MNIVDIKISSTTESRLDHVRAELDSCSASSSFDETLLALIDLAEDHPTADFDLPEYAKKEDTEMLL